MSPSSLQLGMECRHSDFMLIPCWWPRKEEGIGLRMSPESPGWEVTQSEKMFPCLWFLSLSSFFLSWPGFTDWSDWHPDTTATVISSLLTDICASVGISCRDKLSSQPPEIPVPLSCSQHTCSNTAFLPSSAPMERLIFMVQLCKRKRCSRRGGEWVLSHADSAAALLLFNLAAVKLH